MNKINVITDHLDQPIWCVYGAACQPSIVHCKVSLAACTLGGTPEPVVWGYSVYRRKPGYRTLGLTVAEMAYRYSLLEFYEHHEFALTRIRELTQLPKKPC